MEKIKLNTIKQFTGIIHLETGLHIGAGDSEIHIGGTDSPVVKHPQTLEPYIPGSSLKGKIRSLLELSSGTVPFNNGNPVSFDTYTKSSSEEEKKSILNIIKLFGVSAGSKVPQELEDEILLGRLSFYDCYVKNDKKEDLILSEIKAENVINRKNSMATPRFMERVPRGVDFEFKLTFKEFDATDNEELLKLLAKGMRLLELDSLGGSGSRGCGKIKFEDLKLDDKEFVLPEKI